MARNPGNLYKGEYDTPIECIDIDEVPDFNIPDFDMNNPKEVTKYLYEIEKVCRRSFEYTQFVSFLKNFGNLNKCSFFELVTSSGSNKVKIELHHEPLSLFDIVEAVYNKRKSNNESLHIEMVAKEVMYNHYLLHIGLIPLATTVHELVTNRFLFIPSTAVLGQWEKFIEDYKPYMSVDTLANIKSIQEHTKMYNFDEETKVLKSALVSINVDDPEYRASLDEVFKKIKDRLNEIDSKKEVVQI